MLEVEAVSSPSVVVLTVVTVPVTVFVFSRETVVVKGITTVLRVPLSVTVKLLTGYDWEPVESTVGTGVVCTLEAVGVTMTRVVTVVESTHPDSLSVSDAASDSEGESVTVVGTVTVASAVEEAAAVTSVAGVTVVVRSVPLTVATVTTIDELAADADPDSVLAVEDELDALSVE